EIEYISSAVTYFERLRQLEEKADRIVILAGPISYLLSSKDFHSFLPELLRESLSDENGVQDRFQQDIDRIVEILSERKRAYEQRRPAIINLISALDIERLLRSGFVGRPLVPQDAIQERRRRAMAEVEHFAKIVEAEPIGVQIGV